MGTLFVVATPIGNLEDLSPRALRVLREVDLIAAEDTRHSRNLLAHFGVQTPVISYHQHNRRARRGQLLAALEAGDVALISDAGTPAVSDPGADVVAAALAAGFTVCPVPGPSALTAAVSASGLIDGPFLSLGFLPREPGERKRLVARGAASGLPLVIFEPAERLNALLQELSVVLGDRKATLLRELTKMHEEIRTGFLEELRIWASNSRPRGEIVLVVGGGPESAASADEVAEVLRVLRRSGLSMSQAAREAATITGLPRSDLYTFAREIDRQQSTGLEGELPLADENALQNALGNEKRPQ
ncbi:MAG: 16S rRNA (cytidine(1402)-2'-O)-methyltransferase [Chloroflexia bacterium]|nr:16S rRNA (cytidine(1402)-2'-O)-methyltransferase [Chloroflexia bacterium]